MLQALLEQYHEKDVIAEHRQKDSFIYIFIARIFEIVLWYAYKTLLLENL